MSDPMTNTDVEDVLASIRRLVSDNARTGATAVQQPPSDRLVLTPSLRVTDEKTADEAEFDSLKDAIEEQDADGDDLSTFAKSAFQNDEPQSDNLSESTDGFEPEGDDPFVAKFSADVPQEESSADIAAFDGALAETKDSETLVLSNDMNNSDGGVAEDADAPTIVADVDTPAVPEDWATEAVESTSDEVAYFDPPESEEPEAASQTLSEKIAALETLVGERRDQFEPDDLGADAYAGTEPPAMEWEDIEPEEGPFANVELDHSNEETHPEPELEDAAPSIDDEEGSSDFEPVHAESETDAADSAVAAAVGVLAGDEDVLDEEALRDLISDIVREELQGALGERITRNVRKLVRREIHRALAAQDLE